MPTFSLRIKLFSRSKQQNAVAAAAYRSGENLRDERTGIEYRYRSRVDTVKHSEILMSDGSPPPSREIIWNVVERSEKRKNSQVAREVMVALPWTLNLSEQITLVRAFVKKEFVALGMIADFNIHHSKGTTGKEKNPHAHIQLTTREWTNSGFGKKRREWNERELADKWRKGWEEAVNSCSRMMSHPCEKIDRRPLPSRRAEAKEKGDFDLWWDLWRPPAKHRGKPAVYDLSGRGQKNGVGHRAAREARWQKRQEQIASHDREKTKRLESVSFVCLH